jgi:hypothetical protein
MLNKGGGKIMARGRKLSTLWKKVNTVRGLMVPMLALLEVGGTVVAAVDTALAANEPLLKAVSGDSQTLPVASSASRLRTLQAALFPLARRTRSPRAGCRFPVRAQAAAVFFDLRHSKTPST